MALIEERVNIPEEFNGVFSHFYMAHNKTDESIARTLMPSFQMLMIFSFGGSIKLNTSGANVIEITDCMVLGPLKKSIEYTLSPKAEMFVVNFVDDAFYLFFGPLMFLEGNPVDPEKLVDDNCFENLHGLLKNRNSKERTEVILSFCQPYLKENDNVFKEYKSEEIENPIKAVAQKTNKSERAIQTRYKQYYGFTSKEKIRFERFSKAIEIIQTGAFESWFDVILTCGFYDQSQLIHDFKHFIKLTPSQYLKFQQDICQVD
ncbi:helix-turn-helix domain-containing protein [Arcticibacterium luteifluviistationis]|uniref:AraC family transcriptional regulator n=1 Tax=Arcticibacterium luteifluviistationis TaxID=1784714 RepID=A0A2Z4GCK2_9BACT|nr:AraC family transcriptional regulator [Arcticibacterium luteifluviistationis]AWV98956.1 AraC family transcriptional regulator [Arcticibacterium luteifluviistationis]